MRGYYHGDATTPAREWAPQRLRWKRMHPVEIRPASREDAPGMALLSAHAFPWAAVDVAALADRYHHRLPSRTDAQPTELADPASTERWVAARGATLVGQYTSVPLEFFLGGAPATARGLSGVAVAPEARMQGVGRLLVEHHLARAGTAWSVLYADDVDTYVKLGYAPTGVRARWRLRPTTMALHEERALVASFDPAEADGDIAEAYARHCRATNGSIGRAKGMLPSSWHDPTALCWWVRTEERIRGYLVGTYRAEARGRTTLVVEELVAFDGQARRALLGALAALRGSVEAIALDAPLGDATWALAPGAAEEVAGAGPEDHRLAGTVHEGLLARVVGLRAALVGRGYSGTGRIGWVAEDPHLPGNAAPLTLEVDTSGVRAKEGVQGRVPVICGPIAGIARILTGALPLGAAIDHGIVQFDGDEAAAAAASSLLALPPPFPVASF
jgi:ribosomal protein S18 acetylase RimI-like enzyme